MAVQKTVYQLPKQHKKQLGYMKVKVKSPNV